MSKISLQFHGTTKDIYDFVISIIRNKLYNAYGVVISPKFSVEKIFVDSTINEFGRYEMIIISKGEVKVCDDYKEFICNQDNNLCITVGYNDEKTLKESMMWVKTDTDIDKDLKKIITNYKRNLLKGAWVLNPNTKNKAYYKNHRYTFNAKKAYENGVIIKPIAGWNKYELITEENNSE